MQQDLGNWYPELRPLQVELQEQVLAALAQQTGRDQSGFAGAGGGWAWTWAHSVTPSGHMGLQAPVPPLLDAARQVLCHFSDALLVTTAAAEQQGQSGLDKGPGRGIPILAPGLGLSQNQFHQAYEFWSLDTECQLFPPLL